MTPESAPSAARTPLVRVAGVAVAALLTLAPAGCSTTSDDGARSPAVTAASPSGPPSATPSGADTTATPTTPAPSPAAVPTVPRVDASVLPVVTPRGEPPTTVRVDDLDIAMDVLPVGVAPDGQTEVPPDALDAGWYRFGPGVGSAAGATVILAHSGSVVTPLGPFSRLEDLGGGELVTIGDATGGEHRYRVTSVEVLEKASLDLGPYFVRDGDPRLVLITCGGQWDERASSYRSNVIVTAEPV